MGHAQLARVPAEAACLPSSRAHPWYCCLRLSLVLLPACVHPWYCFLCPSVVLLPAPSLVLLQVLQRAQLKRQMLGVRRGSRGSAEQGALDMLR